MTFSPVYMESSNDCYPACLASIMGVPKSEVPNFFDGIEDDRPNYRENVCPEWNANVRKFLAGYNLDFILVGVEEETLAGLKGRYIVSGEGPRGMQHATIWEDGKMIHDPKPEGGGIKPPYAVELLFIKDPSLYVEAQRLARQISSERA